MEIRIRRRKRSRSDRRNNSDRIPTPLKGYDGGVGCSSAGDGHNCGSIKDLSYS